MGYVLMAMSCQQKAHETQHSEVKETVEPKNEMVALMDEMMQEMHAEATTGNIDKDYAQMMAAHHEGAVDMSELLLEKGKDSDLRAFAEKVIAAQKEEIALMQKIPNGNASSERAAFEKAMHQSMAAMMDKTIPVHQDIDKDYAQQMIPHHQSAVDMARAYLQFGKNPELTTLSENIVKNQTTEIQQLQDWLKSNP